MTLAPQVLGIFTSRFTTKRGGDTRRWETGGLDDQRTLLESGASGLLVGLAAESRAFRGWSATRGR